jgi:hypothetical protein
MAMRSQNNKNNPRKERTVLKRTRIVIVIVQVAEP